ncbi:Gfo/Idh/MocA family protein [Mahella australiensis]|uniref:Oxidoreductase domain protein n=1 Tax=Mahella australiensis (strain DSM 15567 / CIP 107919 / 50-1 BON) TaxID=697281 RepID=F3ZVN7_MAHA5|nr:Gfo/Idh/MocA family oxidoreductase [Mahella australiensis]AEE97431.1 oxidoreductase domain protein [Mahella australiensis 50-1 BON]
MMKKIRVGIAGTGYTIGIAGAHVNTYLANPNVGLLALYDIVPGRAQEWAERRGLKGVAICGSYEELLDSVDAVSICTPNNAHADLSIKALEAGKHVLCEKPISNTVEGAERMVACAEKHPELVNMTGFCYRGIPAIAYMKHIIDEGKIGKIFGCTHQLGGGRIANPEDVLLEWRMQKDLSGPGALADFGSHMLDLTDYLLRGTEGEIREVTSLLTTSIKERNLIGAEGKGPVTNDDTAAFSVKMENGAVSTFFSNRLGISNYRWEIIGEGGMLIYDGNDNKVRINLKDKKASFGPKFEEVEVPEEFRVANRFNEEIDEFIGNILSGRHSERDFKRGLYIERILDALERSAEEGITIKL